MAATNRHTHTDTFYSAHGVSTSWNDGSNSELSKICHDVFHLKGLSSE